MPGARGYFFARPHEHHWASPNMAAFLDRLSEEWAARHPAHPFGLGDISLRNGLAPPVHHTHILGSCVDIYVIHSAGHASSLDDDRVDERHRAAFGAKESDIYEPDYDRERTKELARLICLHLLPDFPMVQFLCDDPEVQAVHEKIRPSKRNDHRDHFHIQLGEAKEARRKK